MILSDDIEIIPATELDDATRRKCLCDDEDYVISRRNSRIPSSVVNSAAASLLQAFRKPKTIVEAALEICLEKGKDPERVLESVFAVLEPLIRNKWLLSVRDVGAERKGPTLALGEAFDAYSVVTCIQELEDTEVYKLEDKLGNAAALKIARPEAAPAVKVQLIHEAAILTHLGGWPAPKLLGSGERQGRSYLITEWISGVWVTNLASEARQLPLETANATLLKLCVSVLKAYEALHGRHVLHGDVYPKNVIADDQGLVTLVDFGHARMIGDSPMYDKFRRGVPEYFEPELAKSIIEGSPRLASTEKGEQYSISAMLYLLLTGAPYLEFSLVKDAALRQIVCDEPLHFMDRGALPWPEMEYIIRRALQKEPAARFNSIVEFREGLENVTAASTPLTAPTSRLKSDDAFDFDELEPNLILPDVVPQCSISFGAAGIAFALLCASSIRENAKWLSMADAWASRAELQVSFPGAFTSKYLGLDERDIDGGSVWFGAPGVYLVKALVSQAIGDELSVQNAINAYCNECRLGTTSLDLTIGKAGQLLGCCLLLDALSPDPSHPRSQSPAETIAILASEVSNQLARKVESLPVEQHKYLGMAHGSAGELFALLSWSEISGEALSTGVIRRLEELATFRQDWRGGTRFPIRPRAQSSFMESWCHGTPGYVHLWSTAHRVLKDETYCDLFLRSACTAWEADNVADTLCCGDAGRAYSMIEAYRHTRDATWLTRAQVLARQAVNRPASGDRLKYAFYKGLLGAQLLTYDLEFPLQATMPFVGRNRR